MKYILLLIGTLIFASCATTSPQDIALPANGTGSTGSLQYQLTLDPDAKLALAKKRKSYMVGIRKGDFYSLRNAPEEALASYLSIAEKLPEDILIRKKIAHVYFLLSNWKKSYETYVGVPIAELSDAEQSEMYRALFFDGDRIDRLTELARLPVTLDTDYYHITDACYGGIHNCIVSIQSYTGSQERVLDLALQIKNASKISEDLQYRNLLVAAKFYEYGMYRASAKIAHEILNNRGDYLEATKIEAFSLFELGDYEKSKVLLLNYLDKNPTDLESIVRMGELQYHLADYAGSNLYLNNAIIAGYTPKTNLERRLIYNYTLLGDDAGAMKVLGYLLQESDVMEDDFAVGISFALAQGQNEKAKSWSEQALVLYKNSPLIEPLYIQTLRLLGDRDNASAIIQNTSQDTMVKNPSYLLEKAILLLESGNTADAKNLFETLLELESWPDIVRESQVYLDRIKTLETASGSTSKWW